MSHVGEVRRVLRSQRALVVDAVVALVLALLSTAHTGRPGSTAADQAALTWWLFGAMLVVGLLVRHRWPLPALLLAVIGATAHALDPYVPLQPLDLAVPIILYTLASRIQSRWIPRVALGGVLASTYVVNLVNLTRPGVLGGKVSFLGAAVSKEDLLEAARAGNELAGPPRSALTLLGEAAGSGLSIMLILVLAFAWGEGVRSRREHLRVVIQHAADLERERDQRAALAAAAERARLTREMHDVIAHSLSVIVAQAQAAVAAQHRRPDLSAQAMREVITVGRTSLAEMRQLLGAVRPDSDDDHVRSPQPGVGQLPALVDRVRGAGMTVRFDVEGDPVALPAGLDLSAYRIVQEALTNTLKHAGAHAQAGVRLAFVPDHVEVEVTDDGAGRPVHQPVEAGNGLRGIAERVKLFGGELTTGPGPQGGFVVRARLPLHREEAGGSEPISAPASLGAPA
ncbi:sensor histidine kinase [Actinopolymorpha alba]|uniref:sensor histidine kinase n=1 Tax=Actinopolymorpha alba TaxID=533267 RepID=UPI0007C7E2CB|nr:histidine kinase [Actinopolymorpha alba]